MRFQDIEKLGSKKGVILQAIKDVLQSLVDDDLVHQEKIGSSNYFWSFPSEASLKLEQDMRQVEADLEAVKSRQQKLRGQIAQAREGKQASADRSAQLALLHQLQQDLANKQQELVQYQDNDPETMEAMKSGVMAAKDGANRWLDNIWALQSWCKRQFTGREKELEEFFKEQGYDDEMDILQ